MRLGSGVAMLIQPPLFTDSDSDFSQQPSRSAPDDPAQPVRARGRAAPHQDHRAGVWSAFLCSAPDHAAPPQTRPESANGSLRVIVSGAAALRPELAREVIDDFGDLLFDLYGTTETGGRRWRPPRTFARSGHVGRPAHGVALAVLDDDGSRLPEGAVGNVYVGSRLAFGGYTGVTATDRPRPDEHR